MIYKSPVGADSVLPCTLVPAPELNHQKQISHSDEIVLAGYALIGGL
jgi:hypothetical protein